MSNELRTDSKGNTRILLGGLSVEIRERLAARSKGSGISQAELMRMGVRAILDQLDQADAETPKPTRRGRRRAQKSESQEGSGETAARPRTSTRRRATNGQS
jgi:hypothetical protein